MKNRHEIPEAARVYCEQMAERVRAFRTGAGCFALYGTEPTSSAAARVSAQRALQMMAAHTAKTAASKGKRKTGFFLARMRPDLRAAAADPTARARAEMARLKKRRARENSEQTRAKVAKMSAYSERLLTEQAVASGRAIFESIFRKQRERPPVGSTRRTRTRR